MLASLGHLCVGEWAEILNRVQKQCPITSPDRPGPRFSACNIDKKLGGAWVRGYIHFAHEMSCSLTNLHRLYQVFFTSVFLVCNERLNVDTTAQITVVQLFEETKLRQIGVLVVPWRRSLRARADQLLVR